MCTVSPQPNPYTYETFVCGIQKNIKNFKPHSDYHGFTLQLELLRSSYKLVKTTNEVGACASVNLIKTHCMQRLPTPTLFTKPISFISLPLAITSVA